MVIAQEVCVVGSGCGKRGEGSRRVYNVCGPVKAATVWANDHGSM